jgi:hypothetical protein
MFRSLFKTITCFLIAVLVAGSAATGQVGRGPRVFLLEVPSGAGKMRSGDPTLKKIDDDAKQALKVRVLSLTTKESTPPSGDKHDYMSQAPYFWPNPASPNGLPYIRRDGERNPEIKKYPDHDLLDKMISTTERLSLGYFVTGKGEYAAGACEILRMWFLDPKTRMNPHLEFAQAVPGVNTGRGIGIIETRGLTRVIDSVGLLAGAASWKPSDQAGVEEWFSKYLSWLMESKNGRQESDAKNNHGTYYDVQIASFALFVGKPALAKSVLENAKSKRIAFQIDVAGRQPLELERTKSWDYSVMNLEGMISLALLGDHVGVDLWTFQTPSGSGIRKAIEFLEPYARQPKKWTYKQITPIQTDRYYNSVLRAGKRYKDEGYRKLLLLVPKMEAEGRDVARDL